MGYALGERVRIVGSGVRGWLDASHERSNWLKYIRSTATPHLINLRHILIGGEILYETIRDIAIGEELLLGLREPLQLQDILGENATEDRSDRETGGSTKQALKTVKFTSRLSMGDSHRITVAARARIRLRICRMQKEGQVSFEKAGVRDVKQ
uniref:SET domain-containing protein n=1 Tax=Vespula pensylvanica TaxID=30213 RepID=A0A834K6L9_VESPE|nr:hypothetical protein H0235_015843 [Vespula pensylvanica]